LRSTPRSCSATSSPFPTRWASACSPRASSRFAAPLRDEAQVARLAVPDLARLRYVFDAVAEIRRALAGRVPLIGFAGSPWTLACYMVEGQGTDDYRLVKTMLYDRPDLLHRILAINAEAVAAYLNAQIDAGAQAVMVFDSWGGVLADGAFQAFSLAYTRKVLDLLKRDAVGACRASFSPKAADRGSRRSPHRAPTSSASTGRCISEAHARASATAWRCKATSIRRCSSLARRRSEARSRMPWPASVVPTRERHATGTSSISATASASTPHRRASRCWSMRCIAFPRLTTAPSREPVHESETMWCVSR
jgi:hypothetical protein